MSGEPKVLMDEKMIDRIEEYFNSKNKILNLSGEIATQRNLLVEVSTHSTDATKKRKAFDKYVAKVKKVRYRREISQTTPLYHETKGVDRLIRDCLPEAEFTCTKYHGFGSDSSHEKWDVRPRTLLEFILQAQSRKYESCNIKAVHIYDHRACPVSSVAERAEANLQIAAFWRAIGFANAYYQNDELIVVYETVYARDAFPHEFVDYGYDDVHFQQAGTIQTALLSLMCDMCWPSEMGATTELKTKSTFYKKITKDDVCKGYNLSPEAFDREWPFLKEMIRTKNIEYERWMTTIAEKCEAEWVKFTPDKFVRMPSLTYDDESNGEPGVIYFGFDLKGPSAMFY